MLLGYFDPVNIIYDNKQNSCSGYELTDTSASNLKAVFDTQPSKVEINDGFLANVSSGHPEDYCLFLLYKAVFLR